jgi:hypothetical protein
MLEIREEIKEDLRVLRENERTNILLEMALEIRMMFDGECLKRVVLRYFKEKKEGKNE